MSRAKVLKVHPAASIITIPGAMDGERVIVAIPLSKWHSGDIWTGSGQISAWEDAASRLPAEPEVEEPVLCPPAKRIDMLPSR